MATLFNGSCFMHMDNVQYIEPKNIQVYDECDGQMERCRRSRRDRESENERKNLVYGEKRDIDTLRVNERQTDGVRV